jgi:hypothetical protein
MGHEYEPRAGEYLLRYGLLIIGALTSNFWSLQYEGFLRNYGIPNFWGYAVPLVLLTLLILAPDIYRVARGAYLLATRRFAFVELLDVIHASTMYRGKPMFYVDRSDQHFFRITYESKLARFAFQFRRFMFHQFPVLYYNVSAKPFLNWIDYLYLRLMRDLRRQLGVRVIIALHFDEQIYREGFFSDAFRDSYKQLFMQASEIAKKVIGNDTQVIDERWFLEQGARGARRFVEYFFGIMIAKINDLALKLEGRELTFGEFYRLETNLISILSIIVTAQKFGHLFVCDYEGSFRVWDQTPFSEFKRQNRIVFIKGSKLTGPRGERLPAWSADDGVNLTDDTDTMRNKIQKADEVVVDTMLDVFGRTNVNPSEKRACLFDLLRQIKAEEKL